MTDSESDAGFIQLRNRLLELLYSSKSSLTTDQIARILGVSESIILAELQHVCHRDLIYDAVKGTVCVCSDVEQGSAMQDAIGDAFLATAPSGIPDPLSSPTGIKNGGGAKITHAIIPRGGAVSDGGVGSYTAARGKDAPLRINDMPDSFAATTVVTGNPVGVAGVPYPKYGSHSYYPNRGVRSITTKGALRKTKYRRPVGTEAVGKGGGLEDESTAPIGRVGYVCVADEFRLSEMEAYYRTQGYYTKFGFDVLHIRFSDKEMHSRETHSDGGVNENDLPGASGLYGRGGKGSGANGGTNTVSGGNGNTTGVERGADRTASAGYSKHPRNAGFDLFVFGYGAVVWWGFDQRFFKIVEKDFMLSRSPISPFMVNRYDTQLVNGNYPVWCTYNLARKESLEPDEHFREQLRFDNFLIPCGRGDFDTSNVCMLCVSHALAQSAKIDYLELKVQELAEGCSPLPRELREKGQVTITERRLLRLRGEVLSYRLMLKSGSNLMDEPDFFWENAYLKPVFQATKECFEIAERVEALDNKLDATNEILSMLAEEFSQRHGARLEWIVIWLVFVEVVLGVLELLINLKPWITKKS
ncbi:putative ACR YagE family [Trypanosoma vivax]|uniref:DUF155 domain-containing protein n=1 Tax=Trypanosoma vivax (strain Y486) TaxID=1055687 RepID=G0UAR9_TRYVY|nr:hypothetical protein TRVL_04575 [Trypanosoma vivax]KAH8611521.1 putative ACR YagE family [Trypanosoma vivax]CCC52905.1 conserved hypothetical protein [Trypanosoma vivax Y486]